MQGVPNMYIPHTTRRFVTWIRWYLTTENRVVIAFRGDIDFLDPRLLLLHAARDKGS